MILYNLIRSLFPSIKPLEHCLLKELSARLDAKAQAILQRQISSINLVQRHADCKEVCFYRIKWGRPSANINDAFLLNESEIKLATVNFKVPNVSAGFQADYWLVNGFLFSITFTKSPKAYLKVNDVIITEMHIHVDPMATASPRAMKNNIPIEFTGWVAGWDQLHSLSALSEPLTIEKREAFIRRIGISLPQEYLELVAQTEGAVIGRCVIHGLLSIRYVVLSCANYYVLAEINGAGAFVVKDKSQDAMLYFFDYEANSLFELGYSFCAAIDRYIHAGDVQNG